MDADDDDDDAVAGVGNNDVNEVGANVRVTRN